MPGGTGYGGKVLHRSEPARRLYSYQVRGIDLFGRLGRWSDIETIRVLDQLPPPPPQAVSAQYLDPADRGLGPVEQAWTQAHGSGLKVRWQWPGMLRLQALDVVPPEAEFRIYTVRGELNSLGGTVHGVTVRGSVSDLATNLTWDGGPNELAGERIRVGTNFFEIARHSQGANIVISVHNLAAPDLVPAPGPCRVGFSRDRSYWKDYGERSHWQRRLHIEPAVDLPIVAGRVVRVEDYRAENSSRP